MFEGRYRELVAAIREVQLLLRRHAACPVASSLHGSYVVVASRLNVRVYSRTLSVCTCLFCDK